MSSSPLPTVLNPCHQVRRTCRLVMDDPESPVSICHEKIQNLVENEFEDSIAVQWDEEGWHYTASEISDPATRRERVALYILALDAINFCFWPHPQLTENTLEYNHLAIALKQLALQNNTETYFFDPKHLATLTESEMKQALEPHLKHYLPNLSERCRLWNELGAGLMQHFDGSASRLMDACHGSAPRLVQLLVANFSGFRDETVWKGTWIAFYKRAQIAVADLQAALNLDLTGMEELTTFADYRVPQMLRNFGVLEYNDDLSKRVDNQEELSHDLEVYIRAATVVAVDQLVEVFQKSGNDTEMTAVKMDWHLWQVGEKLNEDGKMKPHHRVNTIFY